MFPVCATIYPIGLLLQCYHRHDGHVLLVVARSMLGRKKVIIWLLSNGTMIGLSYMVIGVMITSTDKIQNHNILTSNNPQVKDMFLQQSQWGGGGTYIFMHDL